MDINNVFKKSLPLISRAGILLFVVLSSLGFTTKQRAQNQFFSNIENIYLCDSLLFISDSYRGISIYSVADPESPVFKGSIPLQSHSSLAVNNNIIYANSYGFIFALRLHADFTYDTLATIKQDPEYIEEEMYPIDEHHGFFNCAEPVMLDGGTSGVGGSYARFAVIDSFLYYLDNNSLVTIDISVPDTIVKLSETYIDWTVETLFPTQDYLYVGGRGGMYVLDRVNPASPKNVCKLQHFQAYDPVVVRDTVAYVALRAGNWGGTAKDVLLVTSVADFSKAYVLDEASTFTPYGLAVQDSLLFVSNGYNGFTLFDVKNPTTVTKIKYWDTPDTKDFIWVDTILYTMGFSNVMVYEVTDPHTPQLLATIK